MIYFQGTDNEIWRVNPDGSGGIKLGLQAKSQPVVYGNTVYFQGMQNQLYQCNLDGTGLNILGGNSTASAPFVTATGVYFRGTGDRLWRIRLDGTGAMNLGGNSTSSTPFVIGQYVFFQGTGNNLWRVNIDGTKGFVLGGNCQTASSPFATSKYVYFRGTGNNLWRVNLDGTGAVVIGSKAAGGSGSGYQTNSTPYVTNSNVFFQGTDNKLWMTDLDGNHGVNLGGAKCSSSPMVDASQNYVYFQGTGNDLWRMNLNGTGGIVLGSKAAGGSGNGYQSASTPFVVQPANQPQTASGPIPCMPLLLVYSPPGSNSGKNLCQVQYSTGITSGTTVSNSNSFNAQVGVTASIGTPKGSSTTTSTTTTPTGSGNTPPAGSDMTGASVGLSYSNTSTDMTSLDIKTTNTSSLTVPGPSADGIDHSKDILYVLLRPSMSVIIDPSYNMDWSLDFTGDNGGVVALEMSYLKDQDYFKQQQPDLYDRCVNQAKMTPEDFAQLLTLNPFATNSSAAIDQNRYQFLSNAPEEYQPPDAPAPGQPPASVSTYQYTMTYTTTNVAQHIASSSWVGSLTGTLSAAFGGALKVAGSLTWTSSTTKTVTNAESQTAIATIGAPAVGYTGPTRLSIYQDILFGTFMFQLSDDAPTYTGTMMDASGKALPNTQVQLTVGSQVFYATTDLTGAYRFYNTPKSGGTVSVVPPKVIGHPIVVAPPKPTDPVPEPDKLRVGLLNNKQR